MKDIAALLELDCAGMLREVSRGIGRELTVSEELQLAMLSGAYKAGGGGVGYCDLERPVREVRLPEYLRGLGYRGQEWVRGEASGTTTRTSSPTCSALYAWLL